MRGEVALLGHRVEVSIEAVDNDDLGSRLYCSLHLVRKSTGGHFGGVDLLDVEQSFLHVRADPAPLAEAELFGTFQQGELDLVEDVKGRFSPGLEGTYDELHSGRRLSRAGVPEQEPGSARGQ